jgi:hypothetical protein
MLWEDLFTVCEEMRAQGEESRLLPEDFEIRRWSASCYNCGSVGGVYTARDLSLPDPEAERNSIRLDVPSVAQYCMHCHEIGAGWHYRYFPDQYFPILREKVLTLGADVMRESGEDCPLCGSGTRWFYDHWDDVETWYTVSWMVCPNPSCTWPGKDYMSSGRFGY